MKKLVKLIIVIISSLLVINVKALCYDEELNEWAVGVSATFKEDTRTTDPSGEMSEEETYAYFLSITPLRDDVKIIVTDGSGSKAEGKNYDSVGIYGVGCYTNLEEETYTIEVYGKEDSACPNELLKTLRYTVPRFNRYIKTEYCEEYPDHELCKTYTNATKDMEESEFKETLGEYDRQIKEKELTANKIFKIAVEYGIYVLVPLVVITIIYIVKITKYKKKEREK